MRALFVVALAGCGRLGFEALSSGDAAIADVAVASCTPGATLPVAQVLNASLSSPDDACNLTSALVADGVGAGLDRSFMALCPGTWDPNDGSCGCLAIDLGAAYPVGTVEMIARPVAQACTYPCQSSSCGTGDSYAILTGTREGDYARTSDVQMTGTAFAPYSVSLTVDARFVVLCRVSYGEQRDDIEVDAVTVHCR